MDGGPDPLGEAAVVAAFFGASLEPIEVPPDGLAPLVELPGFAGAVVTLDLGFPEFPGGGASGGEFLAEAKVLNLSSVASAKGEPLEDEEESGALAVGETAESGEILAPAPTGFAGCRRIHAVEESGGWRMCRGKSVHMNTF